MVFCRISLFVRFKNILIELSSASNSPNLPDYLNLTTVHVSTYLSQVNLFRELNEWCDVAGVDLVLLDGAEDTIGRRVRIR